jgi:hypothetical protein
MYHDGRKGNMEIFAACYLMGILVFSLHWLTLLAGSPDNSVMEGIKV